MDMHKKKNSDGNQTPGYEKSDANVKAIAKFGIGIVVLALIAHVLVWLMFDVYARGAKQQDPILSPLARRRMQIPPQPRLQAEVVGDDRANQPFDALTLKSDVVEEQKQLLNSYGWLDKKSGIVRIPISQAMKLLAEEHAEK
jgi:hypothetical protein